MFISDNSNYGHYISSPSSNIGYIPIPKNASSFMREILAKNLNWVKEYDYKSHPRSQYYIILRDPFERWLAGVAQYITNHDYLNYTNDKILQFICNHIQFDQHTELQINFLRGLHTNDMVFFPFNKNLSMLLKLHIMKNEGISNYIDVNNINISNNDPAKFKLKTALREYLNKNPKYLQPIKDYYSEDYKLICDIGMGAASTQSQLRAIKI